MQYAIFRMNKPHYSDIITGEQHSREAINHAAWQVLYEINGLPETHRGLIRRKSISQHRCFSIGSRIEGKLFALITINLFAYKIAISQQNVI